MKISMIARAVSLGATIGLCGCGGGGGGGGGGGSGASDPVVPSAAVAMSGANGKQVASEALGGLAAPVISTEGVPAGAVTTVRAEIGVRPHLLATAAIANVLRSLTQSSSPSAVHQTTVFPCAGGGQVTYAPADTGTSAVMTFASCADSGEVTNGRVDLANITRPANDRVITDATIDVSTTGSGTTERLRASPRLDVTYISATNFTVTLSGNRMFLERPGKTESLSAYSLTLLVGSTAVSTISGHYTYASTVINGSVTVNILQTLMSDGSSDSADSGVLEVVGAAGARTVLRVLGDENFAGNQLQFDIDTDGNPGFELTQFGAWSSIP